MSETYHSTRVRLERYFDGTANDAWKRLMSDAPVSRIRETVRAGRAEMRAAILSRLPEDLQGARVLDAGCGAGQLSHELAARGADVLAVDISPKLLEMAEATLAAGLRPRVTFRAGDMLDPAHGAFDYVVAMDSLIHYRLPDITAALQRFSARTAAGVVFTVAPRTPALGAMFAAGKLFPRKDRAPAIVPVGSRALSHSVAQTLGDAWRLSAAERVARGFYISQAMELTRS